jgi:hypothetical protein
MECLYNFADLFLLSSLCDWAKKPGEHEVKSMGELRCFVYPLRGLDRKSARFFERVRELHHSSFAEMRAENLHPNWQSNR